MRRMLALGAAFVMMVSLSVAESAELKSGLPVGQFIGAYNVVKCAGNENDGVPLAKMLCYRCKLGNRPAVAVFTHSTDDNVAKLMKELDKFVLHNSDKKAAAYVNLLGPDSEKLQNVSGKLVQRSGASNIAVVVPIDHENGPEKFKFNAKAETTILIFSKGIIRANHAYAAGELNDKSIAAIVADAEKLLK